MNPLLPTEVFAVVLEPGETCRMDVVPQSFRISMAAIDPDEASADGERSTLKMIRHPPPFDFFDEDDSDDSIMDDEDDIEAMERRLQALEEDEDDDEEDEEDEEDEAGAGPSDPKKVQNARAKAAQKLTNGVDEDEDVDMGLSNGVNGTTKKGKGRAFDDELSESDEDEEDDEDEDGEEVVVCTLVAGRLYQQPLDLVIMDPSTISLKCTGTVACQITGNFVEVPEDDEDDYDDYDEDDEDENLMGQFDKLIAPYGDEDESGEEDDSEDDEEDELDGLEDPRIQELDDDEDLADAPALVKAKGAATKGKNKRAAESDEEVEDLDNLISKTLKPADGSDAAQKLSKKQLKKLKKNDGTPAPASSNSTPAREASDNAKKSALKESPANGKKVQFAKDLEQGPTPSQKGDAKKDAAPAEKAIRVVQGVTIDERKAGSGPSSKKGDRIAMRYIGKLEKDGKVFDSNKKGKPFSFKLGSGEVIKGWDVGLAGVKVGGERRITIPASMGYGSQKVPDIPPNSTLVFDVKCLSIN